MSIVYQYLPILFILILFVISLWRQSGVLFVITALAVLLVGLLGRLETWALLVCFALGAVSLTTGVIKILRGDF